MLELIPKNIFEFKTIVLDLTNRCNLKCPLCFRTNTEINSLYDQDFKQVKQLLKKQISNKTDTILLANIYAEPLLYKYINETLDYIKMLSKLFNKKVNTILETNASYQNKEYWLKQAELSKTHNIKYVFSLCGSTQELHSKYRVNANLEKTINNIKTFINHSDSYEIILIEFKYNQKDIKNYKTWDILKDIPKDKIYIMPTTMFNEMVYHKEEYSDFNSVNTFNDNIDNKENIIYPGLIDSTIQMAGGDSNSQPDSFYPCNLFRFIEKRPIKNTYNDIKDLYIDIYNNVYDFCRNCTKKQQQNLLNINQDRNWL